MAKYISLLRFTEKGAREIKSSTGRAAAFNKAAHAAGVRIVGQYWTSALLMACSSSTRTRSGRRSTASPS
jgi:hypothetical protein